MWVTPIAILLIGYLPGALLFRLPVADRSARATLPAEERLFWHVVISIAVTSIAGLCLAAAGYYRWDRLLWVNAALCAALAAIGRRRLRLGPTAPYPRWSALVPVALLALAISVFFAVSPAEYVMGGKDPGVYLNTGIQIAQRGGLQISEPTIASIPPESRPLFFRQRTNDLFYSNRFMGFFLLDPDEGSVVSQFAHLYPLWVAIGYGLDGLTGARYIVGLWALLGVLAVYFAGVWLLGRPAAAAGAALLVLHVSQVWYSRYPNAELVLQAMTFAGLLAFSRAHVEGNRFFHPVTAVLVTLGLFAHITGILAVAALAGASLLGVIDKRRLHLLFLIPLAGGTLLGLLYYATVLAPYFERPINYVRFLGATELALLVVCAVGGALLLWAAATERFGGYVRRFLPWAIVLTVWTLAAYAYFWRVSEPGLAEHDAEALRMYAQFYLSPLGLVLALVGLTVVCGRSFWRGRAFVVTVLIFAGVFFYKMRIIPEHFWTARRFLAVVTPGALLLIGAVACAPLTRRGLSRGLTAVAWLGGVAILSILGYRYADATRAIVHHVEYAGLISQLEQINEHFTDQDLVLVESRQGSDMHVLALPLAYVYGRETLVLVNVRPDPRLFEEFLRWATGRYRKVFFLGGGGTELLTRAIGAAPVTGNRFSVPEYEQPVRAYPDRVRFKEFDFSLYELQPVRIPEETFHLDVGTMDDLYIRRFHAKERHGSLDLSFRWTRDVSFVSIPDLAPTRRTLTLWVGDGGRPAPLPRATATLYLNDVYLGTLTATGGLAPYTFEIPLELVTTVLSSAVPPRLRIESSTWNPAEDIGGGDGRDLGLMIDRITLGGSAGGTDRDTAPRQPPS